MGNSVFAQFSGSNLGEFQYGQLPNDTTAVATIYDRLATSYNIHSFKVRAVFEGFQTGVTGGDYLNLSQLTFRYKKRPLEIEVGNFYETIGRGILLRSFEVPGAILEDISFRSRHYFHRDILGVNAKYRVSNFEVKLIYGRPLNYVFPPTLEKEKRRPDEITALYAEYTLGKHTIGGAVMTHANEDNQSQYLMVTANGKLFGKWSYYSEIAKNYSDYKIFDFSKNASFAFYTNVNYSIKNFGASFEYKNYKKFVIGAGINEPPAGIKEHTYSVLNRSTHVLQPENETGFQFELFYTFPNYSILTINTSQASNVTHTRFNFQEYFVSYDFTAADKIDFKLFIDYAEDPFKLEQQRISLGIQTSWALLSTSEVEIRYEAQQFERLGNTVQNHVFGLGYNFSTKLSANILGEYSSDPFLSEDETETWLGGGLRYKLDRKNSLQAFVGSRRGGPACQAGVCYEVLDFNGVELRFTSRF